MDSPTTYNHVYIPNLVGRQMIMVPVLDETEDEIMLDVGEESGFMDLAPASPSEEPTTPNEQAE